VGEDGHNIPADIVKNAIDICTKKGKLVISIRPPQ
jgi:hypothetical protein